MIPTTVETAEKPFGVRLREAEERLALLEAAIKHLGQRISTRAELLDEDQHLSPFAEEALRKLR